MAKTPDLFKTKQRLVIFFTGNYNDSIQWGYFHYYEEWREWKSSNSQLDEPTMSPINTTINIFDQNR